jgi:hypothetical protein
MAAGSASASTMPASLPPSSRVILARLSAAVRMIACPVFVDPVNMILSTSAWLVSAAPTAPSPGTTASTSAGSAWLTTATSACTDSGVYSEGLRTTVLPIFSAGANCHTEIIIGQFQGPTAPTTPTGR